MGAGSELVEVVDVHGNVERLATRAEMRAQNLRHRSVGVVVLHPGDGAVLVHRRASWKDVWPGRWDIAFGGVCGVGETWEEAAVRELAEEAGVTVAPEDLELLGAGRFDDEHVRVVARVFCARHAGPFTFPDGEVEEVAWVPRAELAAWVGAHEVCPDNLALVRSGWLDP